MRRGVAVVSSMVLAVVCLSSSATRAEEPRREIPFSRKVSLAVPRTYTFRFSLWDAATEGTELWSEVRPPFTLATKTLTHVLGSVGALGLPEGIFGEQVWVQVERRSSSGDFARIGSRTMLPMAPYAMHTLSGASGGGITALQTGSGLKGGGQTGEVTIGLADCAPGQVLVSTLNGWVCGAPRCIDGDFVFCYEGPAGTLGIGSCRNGTRGCVDGSWGACVGQVHPSDEICDGADNDCDPASADGSEDPLNGASCDGVDSDLCLEGTRGCAAGALVCSDTTGGSLDVCDGADNDCDPASADGSEDPFNGAACDGADSDLCLEGIFSCVSGVLSCSDATSDTPEICKDQVDNDCDGQIDEGC